MPCRPPPHPPLLNLQISPAASTKQVGPERQLNTIRNPEYLHTRASELAIGRRSTHEVSETDIGSPPEAKRKIAVAGTEE